jgi:hypothetical protein
MSKRYKSEEWKRLESIQNQYFPDVDILTITGFMNDAQLKQHLKDYERRVKNL